MDFIDKQRNIAADMLDALADIAYEQEQAMRESEQSEWDGIDEISDAERNAFDHYNERYIYSYSYPWNNPCLNNMMMMIMMM